MNKSKKEESSGGAPEWMTTFSDMMTLLMVFFILLFAISKVDEAKESKLISAFQSVFNGGGSKPIGEGGLNDDVISDGGLNEDLVSDDLLSHKKSEEFEKDLQEKIEGLISEKGLEDTIWVERNSRGISIILGSSVLFQSGRADIKQESKEILDEIYDTIFVTIDNDIVVEGHTDNIPISSHIYQTNWELSVTRAVNVVRYFTETLRLDPSRISAQGYGEFKNIVPNDTPENKAKNRRVNLLIVRKLISQ